MQPSIELRWFVEGALPEAVVDWYEEAVGLVKWSERTDRYVRPAAPAGLNVRWHDGQMVIKRQVDSGEEIRFGEVAGLAERWRRWSFPLSEELPLAAPGKDWITVGKRQTTRTFTLREGHLVLTKPGEQYAHGCGVELAELEARHRTWWSLALKAFGPDSEAREMLHLTGDRIFADAGAPRLTPETSMSYVGWLFNQGVKE